MVILVDLDGVIADFELGFLNSWRKKYPQEFYVPLKKRQAFKIRDDYPEELGNRVKGIYFKEGFFKSLPEIPGSIQTIKKLSEGGHQVFICTNPMSGHITCVMEKFEWVREKLGPEWDKRIIVTEDKTLVFGDILIDDKPKIVGLKKPKWKLVLFDQPYNRQGKGLPRITWENWESLLTSVKI